MKFKEGSRVEVFSTEVDPCGSWLPSKILSRNGCKYTVRYELFLSEKGEAMIGEVHKEDVRPCAPSAGRGERWGVDDVAEVFDLYRWRVGKVVKVLSNDCFVVKLVGSIQLKKFHVSDMRVRQAWRNNRWVMLGKVSEKKQLTCLGSGVDGARFEDECTRERYKQGYVDTFSPMSTVKKNIKFQEVSFTDDAAARGTGKKKLSTSQVVAFHQPSKRALPRKVDAAPFSKDLVGENCMHSSSTPLQYIEEMECSVASCSANDLPEYPNQHTRNQSRDFSGSFFDGTTSSCPSKRKKNDPHFSEDELAADIHELELHAYQSTVQALYASGPLSWEQESLLTNLRLSLNISNEEHLLQLRHLLSA